MRRFVTFDADGSHHWGSRRLAMRHLALNVGVELYLEQLDPDFVGLEELVQ